MLDFKTLIFLNLAINVINLATMSILWRRYGNRYDGLAFWWIAMAMHVAGIGLILLRGMLPGFIAIVLGNALLLFTPVLMHIGTARFTGKTTRNWHNYVAYSVYVLSLYYFSEVEPDLASRTIALSVLIVFVYTQTCWLVFVSIPGSMLRITLPLGLVFAGYVAISLVRIGILVRFSQEAEIIRTGVADSVAITSIISLHICLIISIVLALSRRLLEEVRAQEEKFSKAFQTSPYALIIVRGRGGGIVEVNRGFSEIFGYSREDAIDKPLAEL
ncbi:MAG: PAS domain S-box protein, partial [Deltaproteobacteria bacterium]|nr:PAS domain S-box protein [Deltaproteobacteria bacterium]